MDKIVKESNGPSISHKEDNATLAVILKKFYLIMMKKEYIRQILKK
jgi:hypothetical protein